MSKLSFRARALDASKPMPVYKSHEIPDLPDFTAINRAVPQMPTGMEKEEETEHHLQRALSAQQVYGTAEALVIPIPEVDAVDERHKRMYAYPGGDYKPPKQYVHVQPWGMDQEIPDYDMDSEDEQWLTKQAKKMEVTPLKFENMMDRLEKGSGQTVVTLHEAKALLKEDDDLIIALYDYWLNKRLRLQHALIPQVKTEKRDGSTTNNPYVAFRRRTEKMQTRKNRKNDETSYEKMLKLRRDLNKTLTILEMMKRRDKSKKEMLQLTIEIMEKRYQMQDWEGKNLGEAMALRHKMPSFVPIQNQFRDWATKEDMGYVKKPKREYKKRKHKQQNHLQQQSQQVAVQLPQYTEVDVLQTDMYSSDEEGLSPVSRKLKQMSASDHEADDDPDGVYAFKRKAGCCYHSPITGGLGSWPWSRREDGGMGDTRYRYSLTSLSQPRRCVGYVRRRVGRGGRILLDRAFTDWDDYLNEVDFSSSTSLPSGWPSNYATHVKEENISHFRPRTPTDDPSLNPAPHESLSPSSLNVTEFNMESFQSHQEQLMLMQREQQAELMKQEATDLEIAIDLDHSFSSQPTSRFTLDSATARFAASAVCNSAQELVTVTPSDGASPAVRLSVGTSGQSDSKFSGFSTSPPANVLQLNFPLAPGTLASVSASSSSSASASATDTASASLSSAASISSVSLPASSQSSMPSASSTSMLTVPVGVNSTAAAPAPAVATRAITPTVGPDLLKFASPPGVPNDSIAIENHEGSNNLLKDKVVAMEVT